MKASSNQRFKWLPDWLHTKSKKKANPASYFVHIPKTAGTSFIVLLDRFYAAEKIYPHQLWRETQEIDVDANDAYDLYRGHFGGGGVSVLTRRDLEYFTLLRDPNSMAQSTYQFVKREKNTKVHELVVQQQMSFSDFLQHHITSPLVKNRLIRNISFDFVDDPAAQEVFLSAETIQYLQSIIEQQKPAIDDDQRLLRAKEFLVSCRWFGLLERFDESMQLLCYTMHWPPVGSSQKLNTHKHALTVSEAETDILERLNQQDTAFYSFASTLFEQRLADMKSSLDQLRTSECQSTDDLLDQRYQQHQAQVMADQLPAELSYGFDQALLGSQWHRRELMHPENEYFRWTGPGSVSSIDFWVQPKEYTITMRLINATDVAVLDGLILTLNGQPAQWKTNDTGLVRILSLSCEKEMIHSNGLLRLGIQCNAMTSHQQAFGSDDERLVGVAIHWIKFKHVSSQ